MSTSSDSFAVSKAAVRRILLGAAGLVILLLVLLAAGAVVRGLGSDVSLGSAIDSNTYQAVFLTSGQIYFGKLDESRSDWLRLRGVYYLTQQSATRPGKPLQRTLVRLTDDVHQPQDEVILNRDQVLYIENLTRNGLAARLIRQGSGP